MQNKINNKHTTVIYPSISEQELWAAAREKSEDPIKFGWVHESNTKQYKTLKTHSIYLK